MDRVSLEKCLVIKEMLTSRSFRLNVFGCLDLEGGRHSLVLGLVIGQNRYGGWRPSTSDV
jgi:hypothetical protein